MREGNVVFSVYLIFISGLPLFNVYGYHNSSCGTDKSRADVVHEGVARIETYPWLGYLFYLSVESQDRYTTTIVLVTKQIAIGTASEIDRIPKYDFRARSRVVLGHNCSWPSIPVRDYVYHPDYTRTTHSAPAMVQLDLDYVRQELIPICSPPPYFIDAVFYAMTLTPDCNPIVQIYQMDHVDPAECKIYYRKSGLNLRALWPTYTACGKAHRGGDCLWRSGTVLAMKQAGRWRLLGFGIYGPGCEAPARFLDYGMYHQWVKQNVRRMGRPTITRIGRNQVILRRKLANLQRFGPCDLEEMKEELYTEETTVAPEIKKLGLRRVRYNMTVYANVEYSCVVFSAENYFLETKAPLLRLRRWCAGSQSACSGFQYIEIDFYVEIYFTGPITFKMRAYGRKAMGIDPKLAMKYANQNVQYPPITTPEEVKDQLRVVRAPWADIAEVTSTTPLWHGV